MKTARLKSTRLVLFVVCAASVVLPAAVARGRHASGAQGRVVLGVRLRPELAAWLDEIERRTGRELYAERAPLGPLDEAEGFVGGENYVAERGTPILRVNVSINPSDTKRVESIIAHELLHLRQRARGFPVFQLDDERSSAGARRFMDERVVGDLLEGVEHFMFAAEMRGVGLDTVADMIGGLARAKRQGPSNDHPLNTTYYFRAQLEYKDAARLSELRRVYLANGWSRSVGRGHRLAALVRAEAPREPADLTRTFLRCATILYGGAFRFDARPAPARAPRDRIHPTMLVTLKRGGR